MTTGRYYVDPALPELLNRIASKEGSHRSASKRAKIGADVLARVARGDGSLSELTAQKLVHTYGEEWQFTIDDLRRWGNLDPPEHNLFQGPDAELEAVRRMTRMTQRISASGEWPNDDEYVPASVVDPDCRAIRVKGDCMAPKIADGDTVIVDSTRQGEVGKVIVWWSQSGWTLKRLRQRNGTWLLVPDNPAYPPIEIDPEQSHILGVVIRVVKPEP